VDKRNLQPLFIASPYLLIFYLALLPILSIEVEVQPALVIFMI
jgi:hypothetical protein